MIRLTGRSGAGKRICVATFVALVVAIHLTAAVCDATTISLAQLTLPSAAPNANAAGIQQDGLYVTAPIVVDGSTLFRIASPANAPATRLPISLRQFDVQTTIAELLAKADAGRSADTEYDPASLRIHVQKDLGGDVISLEAVDAKHPDPLPVVTVTTDDAKYDAVSLGSLAAQWQSILQSSLIRALELRAPAVERRSLESVARVAAMLALATLVVWSLVALANRRAREASDLAERRARDVETQRDRVVRDAEDAHRNRRRFLAVALKLVEPEGRLRFYRSIAEALVWLAVLGWFVTITWALSLFPQTTPLAATLVQASLRIVTTVVVTLLLNRILDVAIARVATISERRPFASSEDRARLILRIPTIARALAGFKTFVLVFLAVLAVLGELGVPIGSVVTIGGLAAIALSLAAQNFVRDFVNGSLVLFEDHYVVGDYVTINGASGIVEYLSLRMVQIRDASGDVVTIPHSSVTTVVNQSREWSRVDYRVPVDPAADVPAAIALVRTAIEELASEDAWRDAATLPVEWIGIDALSKDWAIVRASVRTAPLRQFEFRRQLNAKVMAAFVHAAIPFGAQLPS